MGHNSQSIGQQPLPPPVIVKSNVIVMNKNVASSIANNGARGEMQRPQTPEYGNTSSAPSSSSSSAAVVTGNKSYGGPVMDTTVASTLKGEPELNIGKNSLQSVEKRRMYQIKVFALDPDCRRTIISGHDHDQQRAIVKLKS